MIQGMRAASKGGKAMRGSKWRKGTETKIPRLMLPTILGLILQNIAEVILPKSLRNILPKTPGLILQQKPRADSAKKSLG